MASILANHMRDIKDITLYMEECKKMKIKVLCPDVNESFYNFAVNKKSEIRFGLGAIKGVGESAVNSIVEEILKEDKNKALEESMLIKKGFKVNPTFESPPNN